MLLRNSGRVLTRMQLIDRVWGADYVGDTKTLDVHIKRLRAKVEQDPARPMHIITVRGSGLQVRARQKLEPIGPRGPRRSGRTAGDGVGVASCAREAGSRQARRRDGGAGGENVVKSDAVGITGTCSVTKCLPGEDQRIVRPSRP